MKIKRVLIGSLLLVFGILFFSGCPLGPIDLAGTWTGTMTVGSTNYNLTANITQTDVNLSGTVAVGSVVTYNLSGTITGTTISATCTAAGWVDGTVDATVNDAGNSMTGTFFDTASYPISLTKN